SLTSIVPSLLTIVHVQGNGQLHCISSTNGTKDIQQVVYKIA
ncbi:unnamed protein product, partial [Rotaria magnacalcarata]